VCSTSSYPGVGGTIHTWMTRGYIYESDSGASMAPILPDSTGNWEGRFLSLYERFSGVAYVIA
jgi:hypothetical protein